MSNTGDAPLITVWDHGTDSMEKRYGACVIVYRYTGGAYASLDLHLARHSPYYGSDWAWAPPGSGRLSVESIDECARRGLFEETGSALTLHRTVPVSEYMAIYTAEEIRLMR